MATKQPPAGGHPGIVIAFGHPGKGPKMPPPPPPKGKKPGLAIAVGIGPKPPGAAPDGQSQHDHDTGKLTPGPGQIIPADHHCKDCANYSAQTGECAKWTGQYMPEDACEKFFTPLNDDDNDGDEDQTGGADQGGPSGPMEPA